jgi:hypothetical protein
MSNRSPMPWWRMVGPTRGRALLIVFIALLAACRLTAACVSAIHATSGDFTVTLPGAYAEDLNPTLWNGPDGRHEAGSYRHGYTYGPAQYLTLWPIVFLDSYRQIVMVLLPVYLCVVIAIAYVLWRLCETLVPLRDGCRLGHLLTVFAAVALFAPLLIAMGQREFEVVQALVIVLAAYAIAARRTGAAGALVGYIAMFKYWPAALSVHFILKRQWKAAGSFLLAIAVVLLAAQAAFGLVRFKSMSRGGFEQQWGRIYHPLAGTSQFCGPITGTAASVQNGVCAVLRGRSAIAEPLFYTLLAAAAGLFAWTFWTLEKRTSGFDDVRDRWRQIIEFSVLLIAAGVVFHAHYYYLSVLILPLTLLLYRGFWTPRPAGSRELGLAVAAYAALSAFVVPLAVTSRLAGRDVWSFYLSHGVYLYGYLLLAGLLLSEYRRLRTSASS